MQARISCRHHNLWETAQVKLLLAFVSGHDTCKHASTSEMTCKVSETLRFAITATGLITGNMELSYSQTGHQSESSTKVSVRGAARSHFGNTRISGTVTKGQQSSDYPIAEASAMLCHVTLNCLISPCTFRSSNRHMQHELMVAGITALADWP